MIKYICYQSNVFYIFKNNTHKIYFITFLTQKTRSSEGLCSLPRIAPPMHWLDYVTQNDTILMKVRWTQVWPKGTFWICGHDLQICNIVIILRWPTHDCHEIVCDFWHQKEYVIKKFDVKVTIKRRYVMPVKFDITVIMKRKSVKFDIKVNIKRSHVMESLISMLTSKGVMWWKVWYQSHHQKEFCEIKFDINVSIKWSHVMDSLISKLISNRVLCSKVWYQCHHQKESCDGKFDIKVIIKRSSVK